jgi:hypothetical protein
MPKFARTEIDVTQNCSARCSLITSRLQRIEALISLAKTTSKERSFSISEPTIVSRRSDEAAIISCDT